MNPETSLHNNDVFVSYSRKNKPFAQRLVNALEKQTEASANPHRAWVDWHDIPPTADWWQEIQSGIAAADAFVAILSPDFLASPVCTLEVAHAIAQGKRVVPLLYSRIEKPDDIFTTLQDTAVSEAMRAQRSLPALAKDNWAELSRPNWIAFSPDVDFDAALKALITALDTDLEHVRFHTRMGVRAAEWLSAERNSSYLLSGDDLRAAHDWLLSYSSVKAPPPTDNIRAYIQASIKRQTLLRRLFVGALITVLLGVIAGLLITLNLEQQRREAVQARIDSFGRLVALNASSNDPDTNREVCFWGSVTGMPEVVLPACERAVELGGKGDYTSYYRDARGIALALLGETELAIADFRAATAYYRSIRFEEAVTRRDAWIKALERNINPFDEAALLELLNELA